MTARALLTWVLGGVAATIPARAWAGDGEAGAPRGAPVAPSKARIEVLLVPAPLGYIKVGIPDGASYDVGSVPAFGVMTALDFLPRPNLFVGFAPSATFNIKTRDDVPPDRSWALDFLLRVGYGLPLGDRVRAYGYLAPGYSFIFMPRGFISQVPVIGLHAGGLYDLTPTFFLAAEGGYQAGFQQAAYIGDTSPWQVNLIQIGLGVGAHL